MRDSWAEVTLGDVADINPDNTDQLRDNDEITYIDLSSVSSAAGISADLFRGSYRTAPGRARRIVRKDDVLISTVRPYLKGFSMVPQYLDGAVASTGFCVLRAKRKQILPGLIWAVVGTDQFVENLMSKATGSSYPAVRPSDVAAHPIALPPLAEQTRIVDVMSSVDKYIAALQQQAVDAQAARNAVLHELLNAGGVDWAETTLGETVAIIRDRLDPASCDPAEMLCHWSIPALDETGGPVTVPASHIGSHKFRVKKNAVAFSLLNPRLPRYVLIQGGENVVCSTEFAVMQPKSGMDESFLYVLASSSEFQKIVGTFASGTTKSRERVRPADLEHIQIRLPPVSEQRRIVGIVSAMDNVTGAAKEAVSNAQELRSGLLSELLSGDHEIPETYDRLLGVA